MSTNACVIQLGLQGVQTDFDVAQTGPVRQLGKSHAQELIEAREAARAIVASVLVDAVVEIASGEEGHKLAEEELPGMHCQVLSTLWYGKDYQILTEQVEIDTDKKLS